MTPETVLETERLRLTGWLPEHLPDLESLHGDPQVARYLNLDGLPWTKEQCQTALTAWMVLFSESRLGKLRVVRKSDNLQVGRAGFGIYGPTGKPELGYALYPRYWGNGYAQEAAAGLRDWIFRETDWDHFIGLADVRNEASLKVLGKIGMKPTHVETEPNGLKAQFFTYSREDQNDR